MKLNQILAVEKGVKTRVYSVVTDLNKAAQKPALFNGFNKVYSPKDAEGEKLPSENQKVQLKVDGLLAQAARGITEYLDTTATKDFANCSARADVVVKGKVLIKDAPVTFLLALEKQFVDLQKFVSNLPVLDENEDWSKDANSDLYKTNPISTHRTKKTQKAIVLYDATPQHPAQTQLITDDIIAGYWEATKFSGAMPLPQRVKLLEKIEELSNAVKAAREEGNMVEAPPVSVGQALFDYLLG